MKIVIEINMDNAAFEEDPNAEVARVLAMIAEDGAPFYPGAGRALFDYNGHKVGYMKLEGGIG